MQRIMVSANECVPDFLQYFKLTGVLKCLALTLVLIYCLQLNSWDIQHFLPEV